MSWHHLKGCTKSGIPKEQSWVRNGGIPHDLDAAYGEERGEEREKKWEDVV